MCMINCFMWLWITHLAVDHGIDSVKVEDLVMMGVLELVVEAYSLTLCLLVHQLQPHQLSCFLARGHFLANYLLSYSHVIVRMIVAAYTKKMLMEAGIQGIRAALVIQNWHQHLMVSLLVTGPKGMVQGETSQGNLENVETGTADVKGSGKENIHS